MSDLMLVFVCVCVCRVRGIIYRMGHDGYDHGKMAPVQFSLQQTDWHSLILLFIIITYKRSIPIILLEYSPFIRQKHCMHLVCNFLDSILTRGLIHLFCVGVDYYAKWKFMGAFTNFQWVEFEWMHEWVKRVLRKFQFSACALRTPMFHLVIALVRLLATGDPKKILLRKAVREEKKCKWICNLSLRIYTRKTAVFLPYFPVG